MDFSLEYKFCVNTSHNISDFPQNIALVPKNMLKHSEMSDKCLYNINYIQQKITKVL